MGVDFKSNQLPSDGIEVLLASHENLIVSLF